ncbi:unnamed protein product, partial [Brassica rapa subsp. trilocularis]
RAKKGGHTHKCHLKLFKMFTDLRKGEAKSQVSSSPLTAYYSDSFERVSGKSSPPSIHLLLRFSYSILAF